jgi:5-methyltetrahydropteroyltriglutamate--homocysteine methyltransferase
LTVKRSTDRILTTHPGRLPNPDNHAEIMQARRAGDQQRFDELTRTAIQDMIRRQRATGIDILSDGEFWKARDQRWYDDRCTGVVVRPLKPGEAGFSQVRFRREGRMPEFKAFYEIYDQVGNTPLPGGRRANPPADMYQVITGPIQVTSGEAVRHEVQRTRDAILAAGESVEDFVFPVLGPGWLGHSLHDEYYGDRDKYNYAMAEIFKNDYHAVIDAGFTLQIDDPALCTRNTIYEPPLDRTEYRKDCEARIEATNWGLEGIPEDRVLYHTCWGSFHTPHTTDMPFEWIVDLLPKLNVGAYSVEAADVRHELDWQLFENFKLPDGKSYYPGVIAHKTTTVEPPELVAYRLVRYANLLGKENIVGSVDCGVGGRCYPDVGWAKLRSLVEGARLASKQLWG